MRRALAILLATSLGVAGCQRHSAGDAAKTTWLVVDAAGDEALDLAHTHVEGPRARSVTLSDGKLFVEIDASGGGGVVVRIDGACPVLVSAAEAGASGTLRRTAVPWLDLGGPRPELGFGAPLDITARPGCPDASGARVTWTQTGGPSLGDLRTTDDGRRLHATMPTLEAALGHVPPWGIVPLSPATRGDVELQASFKDASGLTATRTVHASAAARSRGLPNVAIGTRLYLGGGGFRLVSAPPGSRSALEPRGATAAFTPDRRGTFTLEDAGGSRLVLAAGKYDETPLDCGRSDCHASIAQAVRSNPMSSILQRGLDGPFAGDYPTCALGCHAVGEPGLDDGGFVAVARELGRRPPDLVRTGWHDLPPALRRLGGVGCLACHGPGSVAEASSRYSVLRSDVCATCHDAPPRYGHVAAWRASRMARADADPRTAEEGCSGCHTTWGFLGRPERRPPSQVGPVGIACAACHAVHPAAPGEGVGPPVLGRTCAEALRRDSPTPHLLDGAVPPTALRSRACLACHTPSPGDRSPAASAAALWLSRGGLDPKTGAALSGPAPHASVAGGCVGCHHLGPSGLARGAGHAFQASRDECASCHSPHATEPLRPRAEALWARLAGASTKLASSAAAPAHAGKPALDLHTPLGRAAWNVALVLEDPAADAHNATYARLLLDAAERALAAAPLLPPARAGGTSP